MFEFSIIACILPQHESRLAEFLDSLAAQSLGISRLDLQFVLEGASRASVHTVLDWLKLHSKVEYSPLMAPASMASAVGRARAPWVALLDPAVPLSSEHFRIFADFLGRSDDPSITVLTSDSAPSPEPVEVAEHIAIAPTSAATCVMRCIALRERANRVTAVAYHRLVADGLVWCMMLRPGARIGWAGARAGFNQAMPEPDRTFWRDGTTYSGALHDGLLAPLEMAVTQSGAVPEWLQLAVLQRLHWYFTVDARELAPTVMVNEAQAEVFHDLAARIMRHITPAALQALANCGVVAEVCHALWSYNEPALHAGVALDAYDHAQGLARLTYWIHGEPPAERVVIDGQDTQPAFAKLRACNYFRRRLLRQRIAWLFVADAAVLTLVLDGMAVAVGIGPQRFDTAAICSESTETSLSVVHAAFPSGKGGQKPLPSGRVGWKVRLLKGLARLPPMRWRFRQAWVFIDREENADDNAEHLYRWVCKHYPEVNAWFMLRRDSCDWDRLCAEGFRLVPPGLQRKLLILNSVNIISSHADYVFGGFDRALYGSEMRWRYTFLQHGVIKHDLSHWLGPREFDCFITSSPAEHASIVDDDTTYPYTDREVKCTGLPRHDRLLSLGKSSLKTEVKLLLIMPTWRAGLVDEPTFTKSDYARHWRALLQSEELRELARRAGLRIAFLPHRNCLPYLSAFGIPSHVEVVGLDGSGMQEIFARCEVFVTDYTSVAFDIALLRRQIFYYQFDREAFYGGDHNWRLGYFSYDSDGFGPVAFSIDDLFAQFEEFIVRGSCLEPRFLKRMECAMPDTDGQACLRTYNSIIALNTAALP